MLAGAAVLGLACGLAGCSAVLQDSGLVPTSGIRSTDPAPAGQFPAVGVRPPAPAPDLAAAERARIQAELEALRARNQATARAPLDQPLPP